MIRLYHQKIKNNLLFKKAMLRMDQQKSKDEKINRVEEVMFEKKKLNK